MLLFINKLLALIRSMSVGVYFDCTGADETRISALCCALSETGIIAWARPAAVCRACQSRERITLSSFVCRV